MRAGVLGPVVVFGESGAARAIGSARQRSILAVLAASYGSVVTTDTLLEAVWGDHPPPSAATALRVHIGGLRDLVDPHRRRGTPGTLLVRAGEGYVLRVGRDDLDLATFDDELRSARRAHAGGDHRAVVGHLEDALAAWRGAPFADVPEPATSLLAGRALSLHQARLTAEEDRWAALMTVARHREIADEVLAAVADEPLREHRAGLAMLALARSGRQAEALAVYRRTRSLLIEQLGCEPGPELQRVEQAVLTHTFDGSAPTVRSTVAPDRQPPGRRFVGRDQLCNDVAALLGHGTIVTLVGPPGVGKSCLARMVSATQTGRVISVACADGGHPAGDVAAGDESMLVVFDDADHHLAEVIGLSSRLVRDGATVLVTSRTPLGVADERVVAVPPLAVPSTDGRRAELLEYPAVQLLFERGRLHSPISDAPERQGPAERTADDATDPITSLAELARRLDGLPLALELAAARLEGVGPAELAELLSLGDDPLASAEPGRPWRHRSLDHAVRWSLDLHSEQHRSALARLSLFHDAFDMATAAAVITGSPIVAGSETALLLDLVRASLVQVEETEPVRYRLLYAVRHAGRRVLAELDDDDRAGLEARYVLAVVEHARRQAARLGGPASRAARRRLERSLPDLRAALEHQSSHGETDDLLDALGRLGLFWFASGLLSEGRRWLRRGLHRDGGDPRLRSRCEGSAALLAWWQGDYDSARRHLAEIDEADDFEPTGDLARASMAWLDGDLARADECLSRAMRNGSGGSLEMMASAMAASVSWHLGDYATAIARYRHAGQVAGRNDSAVGVALAVRHEALMQALAGRSSTARRLAERGVHLADELGDPMSRGQARALGAAALLLCGDMSTARAWATEAIPLASRPFDLPTLFIAVSAMAEILDREHEHSSAAALAGWVLAMHASTRVPLAPAERQRLDTVRRDTAAMIGADRAEEAEHEGARLSPAALTAFVADRAASA